jgi:hypothetical protein
MTNWRYTAPLRAHPADAQAVPDAHRVDRAVRPQIGSPLYWRARRHGRLRTAPPGPKEPPCHPPNAGCSPAWTPWSRSSPTATGSPCSPTAAWLLPRPGWPSRPPVWPPRPVPGRSRGRVGGGGRRSNGTRWSYCGRWPRGVGLLRVRGDRLEPTSLRNAWTQIDESLRAGLTFAACCHGVHWSDCGPGRFSMMLRSLDRSNGLVVKPALHDPDRRGERQVVGWSLVVRVKKRSVVAAWR